MKALKSSRAISRVRVQLRTNVSKTCTVSIIKVKLAPPSGRFGYQAGRDNARIDWDIESKDGESRSSKYWFLTQLWFGWRSEKMLVRSNYISGRSTFDSHIFIAFYSLGIQMSACYLASYTVKWNEVMITNNEHTYEIYTKYFPYVNNYKHSGGTKHWR
jgi:hypothetical protein